MAARHNANLAVYDTPEMAAHYAGLDFLSNAEQTMFGTHVKPGTSVLDLGVGGGRTTAYLSSVASTYVGLDYSAEMVRICRARFPGLRFVVSDAADLSQFANESFDTVVFSYNGIDNLCPTEKREDCLRECFRVLKTGGKFIFSSHNPRSIVVNWDWDTNRLRSRARIMTGQERGLYFSFCLAGLCCAKLALTLYRSGKTSIPRAFRRLRTPTYWRGEGYQLDPTHGGLWMYQAIPRSVIAELTKFKFQFLQMLPEDHPCKPRNWKTRWYYYAFRKP